MFFNKNINFAYLLLKTSLLSFLYMLIFSGIYGLLNEITHNDNISYIIGYTIFILYFVYKNKDYLIKCIKDLKNIKLNDWLKLIFVSFFIILISQLFYNLLINSFNKTSNVADFNNNMILKSKVLVSIQFILLAPIVEEFIFRLPYLKIENNKLIKYLFYSLIFAFFHINFLDINDYIFLLTYLPLSLGIGYSYYKTDNILLSAIAHIFNNATVILLILI